MDSYLSPSPILKTPDNNNYISPKLPKRFLTLTPSPSGKIEYDTNGLTFSPAKTLNGADATPPVNDITLPTRYIPKTLTSAKRKSSQETVPMDTQSREKDLEIAIKWLRREMTIMKRQDQVLLRTFLDLRTAVVNHRSRSHFYNRSYSSFHSSDSDVSSLDGSLHSIDEKKLSVYNNNSFDTEFRSRTTSMLTPRNSLMLTMKPRSKESF